MIFRIIGKRSKVFFLTMVSFCKKIVVFTLDSPANQILKKLKVQISYFRGLKKEIHCSSAVHPKIRTINKSNYVRKCLVICRHHVIDRGSLQMHLEIMINIITFTNLFLYFRNNFFSFSQIDVGLFLQQLYDIPAKINSMGSDRLTQYVRRKYTFGGRYNQSNYLGIWIAQIS